MITLLTGVVVSRAQHGEATLMDGLRVLVSGASIAGPAVAFWLERYGADVVVVEKAPELRLGGQLVDLRGVGRAALDKTGLDSKVRAAAEPNSSVSFVDSRNRRRGTLGVRDYGGDGPIAEIEILRGELSRVIVESTGHGVGYRFGDHIQTLSQNDDGVDVTFESGATERFGLVLGADGVHSELRDMVFPAEGVQLNHLGVYLSFWTAQNHLGLQDDTVLYSEPGRTIGMRSIVNNSRVMAYLSFQGGPPSYDWWDTAAQQRIAIARASGMGWEAAQLISQIETAPDFYFDTCAQVKLTSWSDGRVALLGDAAYCASPLSGHGTTMAFVGAYVLAGELAMSGGDHRTAFARYESKFRPFTEAIQKYAPSTANIMTPRTQFGVELRNTLTRLAEYLPGKRILIKDMVKLSNSFKLDDYPNQLAKQRR
jgi:2-polyprenyl-6-methoxyphenol hydroxylase-like FAD-dependent oxidoreductase